MRLVRSRGATALLLGALVCGGLGIVVLGNAPGRAALTLADGATWLVHGPSGALTHVSGLSGRADAVAPLAGTAGHAIEVIDDSGHLLATDTETGTVYRVDPARLKVTATLDTGSPDARLHLAGGHAYVVMPSASTVQRVDPVRLTPLGTAVTLPSVGGTGQAPDGTLWVAVPSDGTAVPVRDGVAGHPVQVAAAGGDLAIAIAGTTVAVVDRQDRRAVVVEPDGPSRAVELPAGGDITVPTVASDRQLPLLLAGEDPATPRTRVAVVDLDGATVKTFDLPDGSHTGFGKPLAHGGHVYLTRDARGELWDLDIGAGQFRAPKTVVDVGSDDSADGVTGGGDGDDGGDSAGGDGDGEGGSPRLAVFAKDDQVWVDDQAGDRAAVISGGTFRAVVKDAEGLAGLDASGPPRPLPTPPSAEPPASPGGGTTAPPPTQASGRVSAPATANPPARPDPPAAVPSPSTRPPTSEPPIEPPPPPPPTTANPTPPVPTATPSDPRRDTVGDATTESSAASDPAGSPPALAPAPVPGRSGCWLAFSDGTVYALGAATGPNGGADGSSAALPDRVVGIAVSATGRGYWLVDAAGRTHRYGDAPDLAPRTAPGAVVAVASAPTGGGFWTVTASGRVTAFGEVANHGSLAQPAAEPVVGIAATATGGGYWVVDTAGRVRAFGDAAQPVPAGRFDSPVTGIAATAHGLGYLLVAADGEVAVVEGEVVHRDVPQGPVPSRIVGVAGTPTGAGYWLADASGMVLAAGDAPRFDGVDPAGRAAVGLAAAP